MLTVLWKEFWDMWEILRATFNATMLNNLQETQVRLWSRRICRSCWSHPWRKHDRLGCHSSPFFFIPNTWDTFYHPHIPPWGLNRHCPYQVPLSSLKWKEDQAPHIKYSSCFKFRSHKLALPSLHFHISKNGHFWGVLNFFFFLLPKITHWLCF